MSDVLLSVRFIESQYASNVIFRTSLWQLLNSLVFNSEKGKMVPFRQYVEDKVAFKQHGGFFLGFCWIRSFCCVYWLASL